ncbi:hypothetical protein [Shewanella spartinae]|uniref:hypothetical protein n=1 Tax=Shewanella spartinae TaxID=2864205 RepID=UPI001C65D195|nr:hypothetical protein [Shewanella spartinae]QYJ94920.1 hypothetical protein K0I31_05890 [Shewanella spartinae]
MINAKVIAFSLFAFLFLLGGCQSTPKSQGSTTPNKQAKSEQSSLAFVLQQGQLIAEDITNSNPALAEKWWDKKTLLDYAHQAYPDLSNKEEELFYRFFTTKFIKTLKSTKYWRFEGVIADNLVFSTYLDELPTAFLMQYRYNKSNEKHELKIVNWQLINHISSGLDAYFSYTRNVEALLKSDYVKVLKAAQTGGKMSEQEVMAIFDKLPTKIKQQPTLLNDFVYAAIALVDNPSSSTIDKLYQDAPPLAPRTGAFWGYYYLHKDEYQGYQQARQQELIYLNNLQTSFSLEGILYALTQNDLSFARQEFVKYIQSNPSDALAYAIYLNRLIELEHHQEASHIFRAFQLQFKVKLTQEDFSETDPQKVAAFFDSQSYKQISRL